MLDEPAALPPDLGRPEDLLADDRFAPAPPAPEDPTPLDATRHRLQTPEGRDHCAERKHRPEPVFGIMKPILGFAQPSLRGLDGVRGAWSLVTTARTMERMFTPSHAAA